MNKLGNFMKNVTGLSKNPLGIIALFVSLIYGFACLVLGFSLNSLSTPAERLPLIWFIIIFPIIILLAFIFLVIHHHEKLYSPGDFRGDAAFIEALDRKRVDEKRKIDIEELNQAAELIEIDSNENIEETAEKERNLSNDEEIRDIIKNTEKWVAKDIELKFNVQTRLNQRLASRSGSMEFDILGFNQNGYVVAEVKYWRFNKSTNQLKIDIQKFARKSAGFSSVYGFQKGYKLVFAVVFDLLSKVNQEALFNFVKTIGVEVDLRLYDYEELKDTYD